jgi:type II secretory pathway pseudopilin PulG
MSSKKSITIGVVAIIVIAICAYLFAPRPVDEVTAQIHRAMRSDLRGLASAQATSRRLIGRYASDPEQAGHLSSFGLNRPVITLADTGWSAIVTHKEIPNVRCAVGVHAKNPLSRFARTGEIVCK